MDRQLEYVWYMAKPGEDRRFASPTEPSPERAAALRKEGYRILRVSFTLPVGFDSADFEVAAATDEDCTHYA